MDRRVRKFPPHVKKVQINVALIDKIIIKN